MSDNIVAVGGRTERDLGGLHACVLRWWQPIVVHDWCVCVRAHAVAALAAQVGSDREASMITPRHDCVSTVSLDTNSSCDRPVFQLMSRLSGMTKHAARPGQPGEPLLRS